MEAASPAHNRDASVSVAAAMPLPSEEQARADLYALLARLLLAPPDATLLDALAAADPIPCSPQPDHALYRAWERLVTASAVMDAAAVHDEFTELFISVSAPRVDPYASVYLAGFLNEKPLAALRTDLARLGLARRKGVAETEDHLGALCETMRLLIAGGGGLPRQPLERQQRFFDTHIAPWYGSCLGQLRALEGANYYVLVADLAEALFAIERAAFEAAEQARDD